MSKEVNMTQSYNQLKNIGAEVKVLTTLSSLTNNIIILTDNVGRIQWVNLAFTLTTGYEFSELVGKKPGLFLQGPNTDLETVETIRYAINNGISFNVELLNYNKSGKEYWIKIEAHPIKNENEEVTNYLAIETIITKEKDYKQNLEQTLQDFEWKNWELSAALSQIEKETEERKKAEEKLIKSENLLKETQKMALIGAWEINLIDSSLYWTEEVYFIFEEDNSLVPSRENAFDYYHINDKETISNAVNNCILNKSSFDLNARIVTKNANAKWVRAIGYPILENDLVIAVRGTVQDITKEKKSQEELSLSRNQFKSILESTKSSIFAIDNNYKYTAFNENHRIGAKLIWGVDISVGMDVRDANINNPDKVTTQLHLERALKGEQFTILEKFGDPNFIQKIFEVHFTPIIDKENKIFGVSIFSTDITERIEFQERIRKSEEQYKLITTNSPFGIFLTNSKGECTYSNDKFQKINYLTYDEALSMGWLDSAYIYDKELVLNKWKEAINSEIFNFSIEYRIYQNEKDIGWVIVKAVEIIENGIVVGYLGFTEDITEIKVAQVELNRLNQLQAAIINNSSLALIATDTEGIIQLFNPAAEKMLDYKEEELIYQVSPAVFHDYEEVVSRAKLYSDELNIEINPGFEVFVAKTKLGLINEDEWIYVKKNKEKLNVSLVVSELRDNLNNITGFVGIAKDITESKANEEEIKRLNLILEESPDFIGIADINGNVLYNNKAFKKIIYNDENAILENRIIGKNQPLSISNQTFNNSIPYAIENGVWSGETILYDYNKKEVQVSQILICHKDSNGNPKFLSTVMRDITERKQYQLELEQARELAEAANKSKSTFLANMSHEIRTPMNAILGFAELIQGSELDIIQNEYVNGIVNSGKSLMTLINDILDLSKIEAGKLEIKNEPVNIKSLCIELKQVFSVKVIEKGLQLILELQENLPNSILIDETRLRQILFNIVGNAVKFTGKGHVKIYVGFEFTNSNQDIINLKLTISDTGIGIPEDQLQSIFEAFKQQDEQSTRKYGGTGLGLTITKRLVEMMNGDVEVNSKQGIGSNFILNFNDVKVTTDNFNSTLTLSKDSNSFEFKDSIILVAEDIKSNQMILSGFLRNYQNINLVFVENGIEAIEKAKEITPDLVFMDIQMPIMDGYEATKLLKEMDKFKNIPIIALTAFAMADEAKIIDLIFDGYITKPLSKKILFEELNKYIGIDSNNLFSQTDEKIQIEVLNSNVIDIITKNEFNILFLEEIQSLSKTIEIDKIIALNNHIKEFAKRTNITYLINISEKLNDSLSTFNFVSIIKILNDLSNL